VKHQERECDDDQNEKEHEIKSEEQMWVEFIFWSEEGDGRRCFMCEAVPMWAYPSTSLSRRNAHARKKLFKISS
jgi:hypothetical protein